MSHFTCFVIVPSDKPAVEVSEDDANELITAPLAPYDEDISVPEYDEKCWCVGLKARGRAREAAERAVGSIDSIRATYWAMVKNGELKEGDDNIAWRAMIAPYTAAEERAFNDDPERESPTTDCDSCHGTGIRQTTYNPKSKWDWYTIGGRWNAMFTPSYDVEKDPRNYKTCDLCAGTGQRNDDIGRAHRAQDPDYTCNGCNGTGKSLKWSSEWIHPEGGNVADVKAVLALLEAGENVLPFAMVTPNEGWVEKAQMGWWAMTSNEKEPEVWAASVKNLLDKYREGHIAVCVDCHI